MERIIAAAIAVVIIAFGVYTYRVGRAAGGYAGFWRQLWSSGPARQVTVDLYIAVSILCGLMVVDALREGISLAWVALYILVAIFMGSFGPLLYLLHRVLVG